MNRLILDSGGVSALAADHRLVESMHQSGLLPASVPVPVLVETLTGDHRRDFRVDRLLSTCLLLEVDEVLARGAARMRTATGRAGMISAVDAIVAACAADRPGSSVLTGDAVDLRALAGVAATPFAVVPV